MLTGVRLTEFHERVVLRFGTTYGSSVLLDHVLTGFGGRTAAQAIESRSLTASDSRTFTQAGPDSSKTYFNIEGVGTEDQRRQNLLYQCHGAGLGLAAPNAGNGGLAQAGRLVGQLG